MSHSSCATAGKKSRYQRCVLFLYALPKTFVKPKHWVDSRLLGRLVQRVLKEAVPVKFQVNSVWCHNIVARTDTVALKSYLHVVLVAPRNCLHNCIVKSVTVSNGHI